ncbi:MAG: DNA polymerase III subunit epsilon, partial [Gemmatimonadales bacterium]
LELIGGRQAGLDLAQGEALAAAAMVAAGGAARPARPHAPSAEELAAHEALLEKIKEPIWRG